MSSSVLGGFQGQREITGKIIGGKSPGGNCGGKSPGGVHLGPLYHTAIDRKRAVYPMCYMNQLIFPSVHCRLKSYLPGIAATSCLNRVGLEEVSSAIFQPCFPFKQCLGA